MENIAFDYGVHKQRICEAVAWVEQVLIKDGTFSLPSKRKLVDDNTEINAVIIDVTECETERPKKTRRIVFRQAKTPHNKGFACHKRPVRWSDLRIWGQGLCAWLRNFQAKRHTSSWIHKTFWRQGLPRYSRHSPAYLHSAQKATKRRIDPWTESV